MAKYDMRVYWFNYAGCLLTTCVALHAGSAEKAVVKSLGIQNDVLRHDETYQITPPFTEYVVPIELPFTPEPGAFDSTLLPPACG